VASNSKRIEAVSKATPKATEKRLALYSLQRSACRSALSQPSSGGPVGHQHRVGARRDPNDGDARLQPQPVHRGVVDDEVAMALDHKRRSLQIGKFDLVGFPEPTDPGL